MPQQKLLRLTATHQRLLRQWGQGYKEKATSYKMQVKGLAPHLSKREARQLLATLMSDLRKRNNGIREAVVEYQYGQLSAGGLTFILQNNVSSLGP